MFPFALPVEGVFVFVQLTVVLMKASNARPISKIEKVSAVSYFLQYFFILNPKAQTPRSTVDDDFEQNFDFVRFFLLLHSFL